MDRTCYRLSGLRFSVATDDPSLRGPLAQLYPALRCDPDTCTPEWVIRRQCGQDNALVSYTLYERDQPRYSSPDRSGLLEYLEWAVLRKLLNHHDRFLQLHAAGAARDGDGLLLCGPPGSGKSTLALALLLDGWQCLSDEITLLEPGCLRLRPFPRSFHLTEQTMRLFPCLARFVDKGLIDKSGKRRLDPAEIRPDWVSSPAAPVWLVFPSYRPGGPEGLTPLGETESLSLLIDQTINLATHGVGGLDTLLRLIRGCSCFRLQMRDLRSGRDLLNELTQGNAFKTEGLAHYSAGQKPLRVNG